MSGITRTREILVDAARQVFAKMGFQSSTMNDIAMASNKGRRTLYTYFKNKDEIYLAVIESELQKMTDALYLVEATDKEPKRKLEELIFTRMEMIKKIVIRNGSLRADFFQNIWEVERARRVFDQQEVLLFKSILGEGVRNGVFKQDLDIAVTAEVLHYSLRGMEIPFLRNQLANKFYPTGEDKSSILDILYKGILS